MRFAVMAAACLVAAFGFTAPARADAPRPPYIDHTEWVHWADLTSLRVYPTPAGREAPADFVSAQEAWSEVLADSPDADLPGMRAQFDCHWQLAELAIPGKVSWNLEPWRPVVDDVAMWQSGCNPGNVDEPF